MAGHPLPVTRPPEYPGCRRTAPLNLTPAGPLLVLLGASLPVAGGGGWGAGLLLVQPTAPSSSASSNVCHGGGQMRASRVLPGRWNRRVYPVSELAV